MNITITRNFIYLIKGENRIILNSRHGKHEQYDVNMIRRFKKKKNSWVYIPNCFFFFFIIKKKKYICLLFSVNKLVLYFCK